MVSDDIKTAVVQVDGGHQVNKTRKIQDKDKTGTRQTQDRDNTKIRKRIRQGQDRRDKMGLLDA